ncbi:MAG: hypothetical protein KGQ51_06675, partial [Planctomycetes bacterium]|nr:hypothetical protein [Planctomycetota bacterium]
MMTSGNGLDEPEPCGTWTTHSRSPWAVWITSRECCGGRTSETSPIDLSQREVQTNNKAIDPNIIIFDFFTLGPKRMLARVSPLTQLNYKSPLEDMYTLLLSSEKVSGTVSVRWLLARSAPRAQSRFQVHHSSGRFNPSFRS